MKWTKHLALALFLATAAFSADNAAAPGIAALIKPEIYKNVLEDREIHAHATLDEEGEKREKYSFYAVMLVHADGRRTHDILTDYPVYAKMVPYIDRANFSPKNNVLDIEGGIWKFKLHSWVQFREQNTNWIKYRIISGHFSGLEGDIFFEDLGEKGTLVYLRGEQIAEEFPPKFVIERGAEIVFGYTARRMRDFIEMKIPPSHGENNALEIPQPRSHL